MTPSLVVLDPLLSGAGLCVGLGIISTGVGHYFIYVLPHFLLSGAGQQGAGDRHMLFIHGSVSCPWELPLLTGALPPAPLSAAAAS